MFFNKLGPHLEFYTKKKISIFLGTGITLQGILIGFDQFMNLVIEKTVVLIDKKEEYIGTTVVRGNEIFAIELSSDL